VTASSLPIAVNSSPLSRAVFPSELEALTRAGAWRISAVAAGLQIIAGTIGSLPIARLDRENRTIPPGLFAQIDPDEPTPATLTRLVEDLVLFPAAYLVVIARYADGYPRHARYVPFEEVTEPGLEDPYVYRVRDLEVPASDVLRFPSHWPGLLEVGARVLRTTVNLETTANRLAGTELPAGILKNHGPDLAPAEVDALLAAWEAGRSRRLTGYLNAVLDYEAQQWNAEELQLIAGREFQTAEVARLLNLPPSDLNAPTSDSLTYATVEGARLDRLNRLRPYVVALESRLSLPDVTPRGQRSVVDVADYLRSDTRNRFETYAIATGSGILTIEEARRREDLPALPPSSSSSSSSSDDPKELDQ
jgi:hypothetical protein